MICRRCGATYKVSGLVKPAPRPCERCVVGTARMLENVPEEGVWQPTPSKGRGRGKVTCRW